MKKSNFVAPEKISGRVVSRRSIIFKRDRVAMDLLKKTFRYEFIFVRQLY